MCAQQPVQGELIQRCQQLQSRLATLTIENEEVMQANIFIYFVILSVCVLSIANVYALIVMPFIRASLQVKKTMEATLQTIQDMVTIEDYDVTDCFHHSNSMESVKSTVSESFMSKPSIAKRRANQQETEQFYFTVNEIFREVGEKADGRRVGNSNTIKGKIRD